MKEIKFRIWNLNGQVMHDWPELVEKNKIHLLANQQFAYPVMQFTGLLDINGVEIYEGDIVTDKYNKHPLEVKFYADTGEIYHCGGCCGDSFDGSGFAALSDNRKNIHLSECIVIGNIYENPELLK